ncbi:uncharacterized protein [Solanum lycopersicum]|uniref:uncharacterized protein n=1 Tax=Solanum lycopersicum TaxID=4081 RepID=UPI0037488089
MSCFVTGVSDNLQEEYDSAMIHDNMNISRLMVHAKHVVEARAKRKSRDTKKARYFDGGSSQNRLEIQDKPRFMNRDSNKVNSKLPKDSGYRGADNCFGYGKSGHKVRDFPNVRAQDKGSGQAQSSGSNEAPKKNHFYALRSRGEQETSPNVVTCIQNVYQPGFRLSRVENSLSAAFSTSATVISSNFPSSDEPESNSSSAFSAILPTCTPFEKGL